MSGTVESSRTLSKEMYRQLAILLPIDAKEACYHRHNDGCDCRKPKPGMLHRAAARLGLDCAKSFVIGDPASNVEAGRAAGCTTIFIDLCYVDEHPERPDFTVGSLGEAAKIVLGAV
jgi:D-glycero-D-manno-heptose 1,7-bisphosphate phosphatase